MYSHLVSDSSLDGAVVLKREEGERAWKESGETAGMVSVLAEPPR